MTQVVRMKFGSHLYGTSTPASDVDYKSVFIPEGRDILLQQAKNVVSSARSKAHGEKNVAGDVDEEQFSLQRFLKLLVEGKPVALDMLFAPESAMTDDPSWHWQEIQDNRDRLLTRKCASIIGYTRTQANKFSITGTRVMAARAALAVLDTGVATLGADAQLASMGAKIQSTVDEHDHMAVLMDVTPHGHGAHLWEVCGRKMAYASSIGNARDIMALVVDEYDKRTRMAQTQQGVNWKALSHAVRIASQAVELFCTGHMVFPRHDADHLLDIKLGKLAYKDVAAEIEDLLERVEEAAASSVLPAEPDRNWIEDFVAGCYRNAALEWRPGSEHTHDMASAEP